MTGWGLLLQERNFPKGPFLSYTVKVILGYSDLNVLRAQIDAMSLPVEKLPEHQSTIDNQVLPRDGA